MADETDFRILARLWQEPFASYEAIGHGLGLSGNTAKNRLKRLREDGVISGVWALPAPGVFRRSSRIFAFPPQEDPNRALEEALRVDPVVWALERTDHRVSVHAYVEPGTDEPPEKLTDLFGPPDFAISPRMFGAITDLPVLSSLDLRVLRALVRRPRGSLQEIGRQCRLTPKTIRAHRDAMFRDRVFTFLTPLQGTRSRGLVIYNLFVQTPTVTPSQRSAVLAALPGSLVLAETERPTGLYLLGRAPSLAQVLESEARARGVRGVMRVELNLFLRHEFAAARIEGWIDDQLAIWARGKPAA